MMESVKTAKERRLNSLYMFHFLHHLKLCLLVILGEKLEMKVSIPAGRTASYCLINSYILFLTLAFEVSVVFSRAQGQFWLDKVGKVRKYRKTVRIEFSELKTHAVFTRKIKTSNFLASMTGNSRPVILLCEMV